MGVRTWMWPVALVGCLWPVMTVAGDGVLEINQACALQTGCFSGDGPGFPVTIDGTAGTSYRLTGDLTLPDANTSGVDIQADYIQVDLNGFSIRGVTTCTGTICLDTGTGNGISNLGPFVGVRIRNGLVKGAGAFGVLVAFAGVVENINASQNGSDGIWVAAGSRVISSQSFQNGGNGIEGQDEVEIFETMTSDNIENGILVGNRSRVRGCSAQRNVENGIEGQDDVSISDCSTLLNGADGIQVLDRARIRGCSSTQNSSNGVRLDGGIIQESIFSLNDNHGIDGASRVGASRSVTVSDSQVNGNGGNGIDLISIESSVVRNNAVRDNGGNGIWCARCTVVGNSVHSNVATGIYALGATVMSNYVAGNSRGIRAQNEPTLVYGNTITSNSIVGISVSEPPVGQENRAGYSSNVVEENAETVAGVLGSVAVDLGGNLCDGATTCP